MALKRGSNIKLEELNIDPLAGQLYHQFNDFHKMNIYPPDKEIETAYYENILLNYQNPPQRASIPKGMKVFTPSSADKCEREMYLKMNYFPKDGKVSIPYQKRWTRNSTLVHEGVQKDLLYMEKYISNPDFIVARTPEGLPAWEENIKTTVILEYKGIEYAMSGMMDGQLVHVPTGQVVGFEFKTKTNSVAQVGNYKMKEPAPAHKLQCVAYSLMFGLDDYIIMYEAVAKDSWMKGAEARPDIRTFHYHVSDAEKVALQEKFTGVVKAVETNVPPAKVETKCLFCEYKESCRKL